MDQLVFVMDESGAKGYSDNTEAEPFELGVAAGFLLPGTRWSGCGRTSMPFAPVS